jgi:TRAP-type C4-dicarboxylate transport system permease small subunit
VEAYKVSLRTWITSRYDEEEGYVAWIAFILEAIAVTVLFALMVMTCLDVGGRYLFNNAVDGSIELTRIGLAVLVFAVMPIVTWRGAHIVVDLIDDFISHKIIKLFSLISAFLISTSLYFVGFRIFELAERSLRRGIVTEFLELPEGYIIYYISIMSWITAAMMISYGVRRIWNKP